MKTMLKLSVIAASLLLASTSSFAANYKGDYKGEAPCPACQPIMVLKDGFYVGAQVGYDSYRIRNNTTVTDFVAGTTTTFNPVYNATGWVGGLLAGYGQYFNSMWYLGGELFINTSGASQSQTLAQNITGIGSNSVTTKFSANGSWGIGLLPGIKLNDSTLLYVRLGYNQAKLQGKASVASTDGFVASTSKNNWQGGFNYGLGMETAFYPNLSLRGEYSHTNYNSFRVVNATSAAGSIVSKANPSDNQYMLALIYHFA